MTVDVTVELTFEPSCCCCCSNEADVMTDGVDNADASTVVAVAGDPQAGVDGVVVNAPLGSAQKCRAMLSNSATLPSSKASPHPGSPSDRP